MDMLVKLYELPEAGESLKALKEQGIVVRRPFSLEKHIVLEWVEKTFEISWASECDTAFSRNPISCYIAIKDKDILGFCVYDCTAKGVLGPMGVDPNKRAKGTGKGLLLAALNDMKNQGYGYGIIGWTGPREFYKKVVGATVIEGSGPETGMYRGLLTGYNYDDE